MSLIRKQINSNLRDKIDEWFDQTLGKHLPKFYTIDDEFNIVLDEYYTAYGHKNQCDSVLFGWLCIFYRSSQRLLIPEFVRFKFFSKVLNHYVRDEIEARHICEIINYYSPYISNLDIIKVIDFNNFALGDIYRNNENKWILKVWKI